MYKEWKVKKSITDHEKHIQKIKKFIESKTYDQLLDISEKTHGKREFETFNKMVKEVFDQRIEYLISEFKKYSDAELFEVVTGKGYGKLTSQIAKAVLEHRYKNNKMAQNEHDHLADLKRVFGLHKDADVSEVKYAYKRWMAKNHPDKVTCATEKARRTAMCKQVNELYNKI